MQKPILLILATCQLALPTAFSHAQSSAPNDSYVVSTSQGKIKGSLQDGIVSYKGIPFAAPPVGDLRWEPPQPAARWTNVRDASAYGHDCMQLPFPSDAAPLGTTPAEDCLYGNVWRPAQHTGKLPIMIWIYGGGFVNGGSSPAVYDGSQFAKHGILFFSFNYRLGRFGFFGHPALTQADPVGLLGNYGYMDQIAAIKWIRQNAAAFGGDPDNVTVFGESAGGFSVHMLMTTPLADGLFKRAMVESGGGRLLLGGTRLRTGANGKPSAEQVGVAFAASKGITGDGADALHKLRALPAEAIVDGLNMASMGPAAQTYCGPIIDGKIVTGQIEDLYKEGKNQKVPLVVGANSMDIGFSTATTKDELFAPFGTKAQAARSAYDPSGSQDLRSLGADVAADSFMVEPARFIVQTVSAQGVPVWEFRFSYVATSMRDKWKGAPHATEIPYVFDTVKARYGADLTPDDAKIAQQTNAYWANYAKTGNPDGKALPAWPRYSTPSDILMNFTEGGPKAEPDPRKQQLDLTQDAVKLQRATATR